MSTEQIIRAWKDAQYRQSLSEDELALVPAHPAGILEFSTSTLAHLFGESNFVGNCTADTRQISGCAVPPELTILPGL